MNIAIKSSRLQKSKRPSGWKPLLQTEQNIGSVWESTKVLEMWAIVLPYQFQMQWCNEFSRKQRWGNESWDARCIVTYKN